MDLASDKYIESDESNDASLAVLACAAFFDEESKLDLKETKEEDEKKNTHTHNENWSDGLD